MISDNAFVVSVLLCLICYTCLPNSIGFFHIAFCTILIYVYIQVIIIFIATITSYDTTTHF